MARPRKKNADYFPHDADMRNDPKIKALRRKFGIEGYAIWTMFLEVLTDSDYFEYEWNELNIELLAGDFDVDTELLKSLITYCTDTLKLLQIKNGYIFSNKMKERFASLIGRRFENENPPSEVVNESLTFENPPLLGVVTGKTPQNTPSPGVNVDRNPQSKVKESKVKEKKVNIIDNNAFAGACKIKGQWSEATAMKFKVSLEVINLFVDYFEQHLITMEEQKKNEKEFKAHFIHWLNKQDLSMHRNKPVGRSNQRQLSN